MQNKDYLLKIIDNGQNVRVWLAHTTNLVEEAHLRVLSAIQEKKSFYRQVLNTLTHGQFHLVDVEAIPGAGRSYSLARVLWRPWRQTRGERRRHE